MILSRYDRVLYNCPAGPWIGRILRLSKKYNDVMVIFDGDKTARWVDPKNLVLVKN